MWTHFILTCKLNNPRISSGSYRSAVIRMIVIQLHICWMDNKLYLFDGVFSLVSENIVYKK